ncbi:uncharacterized protein LOC104062149 [Cuculus canorus]|uniref:uncharacterized protein LOC104062149 n=1 Tax=Cuculus canorus TaxID=55661 RepID=UPI0023AA9C3A|nr:uncharacterized protein LOC104062149 [Cuculus canorus]
MGEQLEDMGTVLVIPGAGMGWLFDTVPLEKHHVAGSRCRLERFLVLTDLLWQLMRVPAALSLERPGRHCHHRDGNKDSVSKGEEKLRTRKLQKFQQKALKQTKQKKSKSAEFLMVKEERAATEGIENPAFNISSTDLSAYQPSEEKVIRHDKPDSTLAAHQQKLRLQAHAEPRGNEYSRNYFDPLMDEEINPRQCGMEVSEEDPVKFDEQILYGKLMELLDEENKMPDFQAACVASEDFPDSMMPVSSSKACDLHRELEDEVIPSYIEQFERDVQDDIILLGSYSLEQNTKEKETNEDTGTEFSKSRMGSQPLKAEENGFEDEMVASFGNLVGMNAGLTRAAGPCQKVDCSKTLQLIEIHIKCLRGVKDKVPKGHYTLKVSVLSHLGGDLLEWPKAKGQPQDWTTLPVSHDGNYYNIGIYFGQSIQTLLPPRKAVKPGMVLLFELFLLRGTCTLVDREVGWGAFPLCDNNFNTLEGKFKCPFLRGHYDSKVDRFKKMENFISQDLDHWLCNLYFQVIKLPQDSNKHLPPELLMYSSIAEKNGVSEKVGESGVLEDDFYQDCLGSADEHCSSFQPKEEQEEHHKIICNNPLDQYYKEESSPGNNAGPEEGKASAERNFYLEELEKYTFSVCCHSVAEVKLSRRVVEHFHFVVYTVFSELGPAHWRSGDFWLLALLVVLLWFMRLYLHYLSQWLFLQTISVPVTKFQLFPHTVELCYQNSLLHTTEELVMVVVGPLTLNAVLLLMVLIKWGCQHLFDSFPSFLSKFIIALGLWTVLDPLAVFVVDSVLGRLGNSVEEPIADAAKLYWVFVRAEESGIPGVLITVMLYAILSIISSTTLYLYFLRLHSEGWLLDVFQRIHGEEGTFFVPLDLEISSQELSYIMKRAEQWRGINGERRMVAVSDYIWKDHASKPGVSSCDLQQGEEISDSATTSRHSTTVHVSVYTVHLSSFQELYRHFLRLPDGAIIEAFGDITGEILLCNEMSRAQECISEMDSMLHTSSHIKLRERKKSTARWKDSKLLYTILNKKLTEEKPSSSRIFFMDIFLPEQSCSSH